MSDEEGEDSQLAEHRTGKRVASPVPTMQQFTKKTKVTKAFDWKVTIATPQTFKILLTIMTRVLSQCPFQVLKNDKFTGLRVDSMDSSMVCMIKASFECQVETNVDLTSESFCIVTDMLCILLKDVQPGHILELTRFSDSPDLCLSAFDKEDDSNRFTFYLSILEDDNRAERLRMEDITYKYMVEIDLARLKGLCKIAQEINASHLNFKIDEALIADGGRRHLFFTIGAAGEGASMEKIHHSVTAAEEEGDEKTIEFAIRAIALEKTADFLELQENVQGRYDEVFSTTYLNLVLKSMERSSVNLYMSAGLPLVIKYSLGNDSSCVQIVLAPRVREADQ